MFYLVNNLNQIFEYPNKENLLSQHIEVKLNPREGKGVMAVDGHNGAITTYHPIIVIDGTKNYPVKVSYGEKWTKKEIEKDVIKDYLRVALRYHGYKVLKDYHF